MTTQKQSKIMSYSSWLMLVFLLVLNGCNNAKKEAPQQPEDSRAKRSYIQKRLQAFSLTPQQLNIPDTREKLHIYGMAMDWHMQKDLYVSVCVFENGRAMLYTSDGNKGIDFQHDNIKNAVRPYLEKAQKHLELSVESANTTLPLDGTFKFYFLTNVGVSVGGDHTAHIDDNSSPWAELFHEANAVISEIRSTYIDFVEQAN